MLLVSRERLGWVGWLFLCTVPLLAIGLAFTFSRAVWVSVAVSVGVGVLFSTSNERKNLLLLFCASVLIGAMAITLLGMLLPEISKLTNVLYLRGSSLFTGKQIGYSSSWQWRIRENEYALATITQHPLLGIGPGNHYRPDFFLGGDRLPGFVHNGYYFILVDLGLAGFVPFAWFTVAYLFRGYRFRTIIHDRVLAPLAFGFTLSYVAILIASIAEPTFMYWYWTPVLGVMLGINEVIYRLNGQVSK